jgi:hypothetical protein
VSLEALRAVREQALPMLRFAAEEYRGRAPAGYPVVVDAPEQGAIGLEIDPSYALYLVTDGEALFADLYRRAPRTDARSSASRQKEAGLPFYDRRPLDAPVTAQAVRNLIAELMSHWNQQPGVIHITDS